ncbi:hypothetical protein SPBR_00394 [Sporothrix brasiliensis 5110]|uniref:Uncharacterized protein n=1 Tax=Sporothrix brasiliensis 5110 TaxID=1398154 RepID=A0A0C2IW01_9PEZI|nr:uncharacterized protein SPBR_00394 [Sporothrix brasiliensis 5110]KIH90975.1 hypothetical protein SPBR_00394 [Sporothrix brasiliensis 5110]
MFSTTSALLALAAARAAIATGVSVTPHDSYSSSVGVLGCYIDTNRVAYWPGSVDCNNLCVKVTNGDRSVHLLRIDQSGGAHDISYDAWNYLQTGSSATVDPIAGGGVAMEYEDVDASECASLIKTPGNKLPLSASNSMNFVASCLADSSSWVGQNHVLYNIADPLCSLGYDETCTLDLSVSNQPSCPHTLGLTTSLTSTHVYNIEYPSGKCVDASSGEEVSASVALSSDSESDSSASGSSGSSSAAAKLKTAVAAVSSSSAAASTVPTTSSPAAVVPPTTSSSSSSTAATQVNSPGVFVATSQSTGNSQQTTTSSSSTAPTTSNSSSTSVAAVSSGSSAAAVSSSSAAVATPSIKQSSSAAAKPTTSTAEPATTLSKTTLAGAPSNTAAVVSTGTVRPSTSATASSGSTSPSTVVVSGASAGVAGSLRAAAALTGAWAAWMLF